MENIKTDEKNRFLLEDKKQEDKFKQSFLEGLERNEFFLRYQPVYNFETQKIVGIESLIRWRHPKLGLILPNQFIYVINQTELAGKLTEWVLTQTITEIGDLFWKGLPKLNLSINISEAEYNDNLVEITERVLDKTKFESSFLEFEFKHAGVLNNPTFEKIVTKLSERGVGIVIDNFEETGKTEEISKFPIKKVKIDKVKIHTITSADTSHHPIREDIVRLQEKNYKIAAEGVENKVQCDALRELGVNEIQGFYISLPLSSKDLVKFCRNY